jgi:hypothetical protein
MIPYTPVTHHMVLEDKSPCERFVAQCALMFYFLTLARGSVEALCEIGHLRMKRSCVSNKLSERQTIGK